MMLVLRSGRSVFNGGQFLQQAISAILLIVVVSNWAFAGEIRLSPKHIAELKMVTQAVISPDGNWIAYNLSVPRQPLKDADGAAWSELHVVDRAGNSRAFITGKEQIGAPQWLPDSRAIVYTAKRGDDAAPSLYQIPIDGGESRRLLTWPTGVGAFAISADGKRVAFLAPDEIAKPSKDLREKGFDQEVFEENWRAAKVWIAPLDGSASPQALNVEGSVISVDWHPTRNELALVVAPTSLVDDSYMRKRIQIVDAITGRLIERINNPGKLGQVGWSPDGKYLACISAADIHDPEEGRLMVATIPGDGTLKELYAEFQGHFTSFAWRDVETILWTAAEGTETLVGRSRIAGGNDKLISQPGLIAMNLTLSQDGKFAGIMANAPQHAPEVYRWEEGATAVQRQTNVNPWLADVRWAKQETVEWKGRDGLGLQGVLVWPLDYVEGRRYPLIMLVHGGPEAHVSNGWITNYSQPGQVAAARGFAVFYPNYRGSTGRGVAFSKLGQADAAGKEFDDLIDGVDHLIETGLVDRNRVGITGGSYGGYASAWGATFYSDRFAASVMFVGISDVVSKVGTTDIPEEMYLVHHLKRPWEDWNYFLDRSPIKYVERNRTPTLILHGKQDPRVHPSQSLELHRHLKTLGQAPVRLVLYEGEGHGNRKAAARFDYNLRLLQWMEHYLQGPGGAAPPIELNYDAALQE